MAGWTTSWTSWFPNETEESKLVDWFIISLRRNEQYFSKDYRIGRMDNLLLKTIKSWMDGWYFERLCRIGLMGGLFLKTIEEINFCKPITIDLFYINAETHWKYYHYIPLIMRIKVLYFLASRNNLKNGEPDLNWSYTCATNWTSFSLL